MKRYPKFLQLVFVCCFTSSCSKSEKANEIAHEVKPPIQSENQILSNPIAIDEEAPLQIPPSSSKKNKPSQKVLAPHLFSKQKPNQSLAPKVVPEPPPVISIPPTSEEIPKLDEGLICVKDKKNELLSFWLGLGFHYSRYSQSSDIETESGNFTDQSLSSLSVGAQVQFNDKSSIDLQYHQTSAKIPTQGDTTLDKTDLIRKSIRIGYQFKFFQNMQDSASLYVGIKQHRLPLLSTDETNSIVNLLDNELISAVFGVLYSHESSNRFTYEAGLNYQQLIFASSLNGYQLNMKQNLIFDASLGVKRRFDSGFYVGLFWGLQSMDLKYDLTRGNTISSGSEGLFDSITQIRLGWDLF